MPGPGDHQELDPLRTKFQSRGHGPYLLTRRQPAGLRLARGPWRAPGRPDLAECSEVFRSQPESRAHFQETASRTGHRPSSGTRLLREAGTLGKAPTSLPSLLPAGPLPRPEAWLERPRRGLRVRLRITRAVGLLSWWPLSASVAPVQPRGSGQGRGGPRWSLQPSVAAEASLPPGAAQAGGREQRSLPSAAREGHERHASGF